MLQRTLPQEPLRSRPLNENDKDRAAEAEIAAHLKLRWSLTATHKLLMSYALDYALQRSERDIVAFAEIKDRELSHGFGDGYYLSLGKAMRADELARFTGLPCFLVVRFCDGSMWRAPFGSHIPGKVIWFGRTDRGQPGDLEPCVVFPWSAFTVLPA